MIKKCRFLAGCLTLSMIFASAVVPAVFAEDAAVSEDETTTVEAVDEISDEAVVDNEAVVDEAVVDENEEVDTLSEDDTDVSVAAVDYTAWQAGNANASDNTGAITSNVPYEGKDTLYIDYRNAYTVLPDPISSGKVTFSLDLYLEKDARNFRIYLENSEASYTGTGNLFAEVLNNDKAGAVYFGPEEKHQDDAHKLFDISSDGWYHFDLTLDYGELQADGSVSDKFITINATDASGKPMCEEMTIGAMGTNVALKSIRIVKTASGLYAANMSIEQGGDMIFAESSNFTDAELGDSNIPSNWTISAGSNNKGEIVNDEEKGHVLMLQKNYDDDEQTTAGNAVFARYKLNKTYSGNTEIEADIKLTYGGRIGMFAASQSSETSTSTISPRLFAWSDKGFASVCNHYEAYDPIDGGSSSNRKRNNAVPPMDKWTKWKFVINGDALTYDIYIDGTLMFEGLNAKSDIFNGNVGQVGFQIQREDGTLGTILISEVRVYNDSIVDPEKEKAKINAALDEITLPTETNGEDIPLPTQAAGYDIVWTSSNPDVIANVGGIGHVVRKDTVMGNIDVVLTATVTYEDMILTREFTVTSKANRDADAIVKSQILADLMDLGLNNGETLYSDIELPTVGKTYGTKISWITSNASVISAKGKVTRPSVNGTKTVTLTAVGELEGADGPVKETYAYTFKVVGRGSSSVSSGGGGGGFVSYSPGASTSNTAPVSSAAPSDNTANENGNGTQGTSSVGFTDLDNVGWAQEAIDYMFSKGYVNGVGDGKFAPNDAVTREQFVKMLVNVFGLEAAADSSASFSDVQSGAWYAEYVNIAASLGIVSGMGDGSFGVGTPISRQDMAVMIARCTNVEGGDAAEFADDSAISDYAADAVHAMKSAGYLSGDEKGNFNPKNTATRAETATVLYRISASK